jgi:hypothetical protein
MDPSSQPSEANRELNELRRRAYGPHPDIQADPAALARLTELEAARRADPPDGADTGIREPAAAADGAPARTASSEGLPRSLWHRLTATRARRRRSSFVAAGALVVFFALAYIMASLDGPDPDATLHPVADEADGAVLAMLGFLGADADHSTIRGYEPYRGVEPWFVAERQGLQCFMLIKRSGPSVDGANCVPPGVDLFADTGAWPLLGDDFIEGLPNGSIVRFHYRGHSVDVFLYPASEAD